MLETILIEVAILVALVVANGVLSMSEIAVVSSRKARLQQRATAGDKGAAAALRLAEQPDRFLATVQVGITLIGVLAGAYGGATLAQELAARLQTIPQVAQWAASLAVGAVVLGITWLSVVVGELVPKRIALSAPETVAGLMARPMEVLERVASPLVTLLNWSSRPLLWAMRVKARKEAPVTEDELRLLLRQGAQAGTIEPGERKIVDRVFVLGGRPVRAVMTPRSEMEWLNVAAPLERLKVLVQRSDHGLFPIGTAPERVDGVVMASALWDPQVAAAADLKKLARAPLYVPENLSALQVLERIRETRNHLALVVDEYGVVEGLVTPTDLLEALVGDLPAGREEEPEVVKRGEASWSLDAGLDIEEVKLLLGAESLPEEKHAFQTVAGYVIERLGRLPHIGDVVEAGGWRFEIADMDGRRVDRLLVTRSAPAAAGPER